MIYIYIYIYMAFAEDVEPLKALSVCVHHQSEVVRI